MLIRKIILTLFFLLALPAWSQLPADYRPDELGWGETIDDFFGRAWRGITFNNCRDPSLSEYMRFRCGLNNYYYDNENSFASVEPSGGFQAVTDGIIFNHAAEGIYRANRCQVDFYSHYFSDISQRTAVLDEAVLAFNNVKRDVAEKKRSIEEIHAPQNFPMNCGSSTECVANDITRRGSLTETLNRSSRITEFLATVPMGNRTQMRSYLLSVADENLSEEEFRAGFDQTMRALEAEAQQSFNTIASKSRPQPGKPDERYYMIDSDLRQSMVNNGSIENILIENNLESYAQNSNFMCRINRRDEGMWVGAGVELAATIGAAYLSGGASLQATPYVLASLRVGSIARRMLGSGRATDLVTRGLSRSNMAKLMLYGAHAGEAAMTYADIDQTCFTPEYLSSKTTQQCDPRNQIFDVISEASIAQCNASIALGVALPGGMTAANRWGRARALERTLDNAPPARVLDEAVEEATPIIVTGTRPRREFALDAQETRRLRTSLSGRNITAETRLTDTQLAQLTSDERLFLVEEIADTAFTVRQSRNLIDTVINIQRSGWSSANIRRLTRLLRDSGKSADEVTGVIARLRRQRTLESAPGTSRLPAPTPPRANLGSVPRTEDELIERFSTLDLTTREQNARYLELAQSSRSQNGIRFVDMQNIVLKNMNDQLRHKPLVDALNNRHAVMLEEAIHDLRDQFPTLRIESYSDYKGARFALTGIPSGQEARLAREIARLRDDVDSRFLAEIRTGRYPTISDDLQNIHWYRTEIDETSDFANIQVRTGLDRAGIQQLWTSVRSQRGELETRFGNTPLMRSVRGEVNAKIPTAEVFELLRKKSDNAEVARILNHRHNMSLDANDVLAFRTYAKNADQFSPNLRIDARVNHDFTDAQHGGMTLDFGGVGSLNAEATAEGLAQGFDLRTSVRAIRTNEADVTQYLRRVMDDTQAAVQGVFSQHGITARFTRSGDDVVVIPDRPIPPAVRDEALRAQAQAQATILSETGRNTNVRVSYFADNVSGVDDRAIIAAEGEGIEKVLRGRLEFLIPQSDLRRLTIGTDMLGNSRGTGAVTLRTNGSLGPEQNAILEREFRLAVADANSTHGTHFTIAP